MGGEGGKEGGDGNGHSKFCIDLLSMSSYGITSSSVHFILLPITNCLASYIAVSS